MKVGCHCVLYGPAIDTNTDEILTGMAQTGCQGVEIGARFFNLGRSEYLNSVIDKNGLALSGLHIAVPLVKFMDAPEESYEDLAKVADILCGKPEKNIIMTGMVEDKDSLEKSDSRLVDKEHVVKMAKTIDDIAEKLKKEYDVQLNYHNHNWEFQNEALIYMTLLNETKYLNMCLDIGWAVVSGYDPVEIMRKYPEHFSYIHIRDYSKDLVDAAKDFRALQQTAYVDIGTGEMDYTAIVSCAKDVLGDTGWCILEYETGSTDYKRYKRAVTYFNGVLDDISK